MIKVYYTACDGTRITRSFKTLKGARKFATDYVGKNPEMGRGYAVSGNGVGTVTVDGCTLKELFAPAAEPAEPTDRDLEIAEYGDGQYQSDVLTGRRVFNTKEDDARALAEFEAERAARMAYATDDDYPF